MEHSEKLRNSSEEFKTHANNSKAQAIKNSRFWQIHLPKTRPKKACTECKLTYFSSQFCKHACSKVTGDFKQLRTLTKLQSKGSLDM